MKPDDVDRLNNLGIALTHLRQIGKAIACFDRALPIDPGRARALDDRGVALFAAGRFSDALESYDRTLRSSRTTQRRSTTAPVQVSYFGFTATMAVDFIDYVLAGRTVLPIDIPEL